MKTTTEKPQDVIGRLETELTRTLQARAEMVLAIDQRLKQSELVVVDVIEFPATDKIDAALTAHLEREFLIKLRENIAETSNHSLQKMCRTRDSWLENHHAELSAALTTILEERSIGRDAYRRSSADLQANLNRAVVLATGGPDEADADFALAQAEQDFFDREDSLEIAKNMLRSLQTDVTYAGYQRALEAVFAVNFEISEASKLQNAQA